MTKTPISSELIVETPFDEALAERYLSYALSTIMSRSLPDVRDGLKPVHRRLLYAMRLLKLDPKTGYKKCARVVGDVIGKYHPHGDQAVYDALVRLAQTFSVRYPLIDGQGNFGNIDGDNAAAMRYTEARLTEVAAALMNGLDEDAVNFRETYDGEDEEPIVLPGGFPNLLANGATGIAVGMATSIPPHNVGEVIDALQLLVKQRRKTTYTVSDDQIYEKIPGPDFPTGGIIVEEPAAIRLAYTSGRGSIRLRARWEKEETGRGLYQIVVTEIPYQVQKARLIEKIAELINDRKIPILNDVRDESSEDLRIVLEPKNRNIDPDLLMESLFKFTDLETRFSLNMNVITGAGTPEVLSLRQVLEEFLDHQQIVLIRKSKHRLAKILHRLEVLDGYLIAFLNLDEVIRIIREEDNAKKTLMMTFNLTDVQAEAILNMRLRALRKLEEIQLRSEHNALTEEKASLEDFLASSDLQWLSVGKQLTDVKTKFGPKTVNGRRRTSFAKMPDIGEITLEAMIEKEPVTIVCSKRGWIKAMKGHVAETETLKYKEGDEERFRFHAYTTDKILMFTVSGKLFTMIADKLPGGRGHGEPVRLIVDMAADDDIVALFPLVAGQNLLVASSSGKGFLVESKSAIAMTKGGRQILNLPGGATATHCIPAVGDSVAVVGTNRKLLIFALEEMPILGRGQGVVLQKYRDATLSDIICFTQAEGLNWPMGGASDRRRTEADVRPWVGKRAGAGRLPPIGFPRSNKFSG